MKVSDMFPSKYMKGEDLNGQEWALTISHVTVEEMRPNGQLETKYVVWFEKAQKGMVLNKSNALAIARVAGSDDTDDWSGKKVTLYGQRMTVAGRQVTAIRVKDAAPVPVDEF